MSILKINETEVEDSSIVVSSCDSNEKRESNALEIKATSFEGFSMRIFGFGVSQQTRIMLRPINIKTGKGLELVVMDGSDEIGKVVLESD